MSDLNDGNTAALDLIFNDYPQRGWNGYRIKGCETRVLNATVTVLCNNYTKGIDPDLRAAIAHMPREHEGFTRANLLAAFKGVAELTYTFPNWDFTARMGDNLKVRLGRNYSPVVFIQCHEQNVEQIKAIFSEVGGYDECHYYADSHELRLWWD